MTNKNWNPEDNLFSFPDELAYEGPLTGMSTVHKMNKLHTFVAEITREAKRTLDIHSELASLLLLLASVDYLAGFYSGRKTSKQDYMEFMERYFPVEYHPHLQRIFDQLRSGLMHNLTPLDLWGKSTGMFAIHCSNEAHLQTDTDGRIMFSVHLFLQDLYRAMVMYMYDVVMNKDLSLTANFNRRFDRLDGSGAFMEKVSS